MVKDGQMLGVPRLATLRSKRLWVNHARGLPFFGTTRRADHHKKKGNTMIEQLKIKSNKSHRLDLKTVGQLTLMLVSVPTFFFSIPAWLMYWLIGFLQKTKSRFLHKIASSPYRVLISLVFGITLGVFWISSIGPNAEITIIEPKQGFITDQSSVTLKGVISPPDAVTKINDIPVDLSVDSEGNFIYELVLADVPESTQVENEFVITADDYTTTVRILRRFTDQEVSNYQAEAQKKMDQIKAELKAKQAIWDNSKAGRLCKAHPNWSKEDCQNIADRMYWIGMTYEMLVASYGRKPDSANPSNYGQGVSWQWCWYNSTPLCFYDSNDDGIIDSYN